MSLSRITVAALGLGAVGLALVGVGAGASFTDSTTSTQTITAGSMSIAVTSPDIAGCTQVSDHCTQLTLSSVGPVSSTFLTDNPTIKMTNTGNIPATFDSIQLSQANAGNATDQALLNEMYVCIQSTDASGGPWTEGNGPLATAVALTPTVEENPVVLQPGETASYAVNFYAGKDSGCNPVSSDGSHTRATWDSYDGAPYHTPAALSNDAQGGSVTPTLSFNLTG
jgi:predicted ribosomally synthesized peptide with SipW-like signal peptide